MADETSIWKKELSFGRKRKAPKGETPVEKLVEPDAELSPKTSVWKKELSFGRKKKAGETPLPEVPAEPPAPVAVESQPVAPPASVEPPAPVASPTPTAPAVPTRPFANESAGEALGLEQTAQPTQPVPPAPVASLPPTPPQSPVEPPHAAGQDELRPRPHLVPVQAPPVQAPPVHEPGPAVPAAAAPPVPPAATAPAPLPGIHPPVPAAELPEPEAGKTPFWKKELSVSLKPKPPKEPKQKKPKAEKPPKPQKQPKPPKEPKGDRTPFWKKDLSLGRKAKAAAAVTVADAAMPDAKPAKKPFWKQDLSLKRAPKAERRAKPKNERKPPIWKRDVSLRKAKLHGVATKGNDKLKLVGLKVGASQVAAARVHNNGVPELVQIAREDLAPGIVVGGELRDTDALAETLKTFFRKNKLPKRGVRLGIANNRIGVRTFDVVGIEDPKQLDNAVRFRAQEALPIPIDEAVLDYQILSEFTDDEGQPVKRVLLVVAYRELVDRYVVACKKAGIRLTGIDLEAFALLRALSAPRHEAGHEGAVVAVAIGSERSTFAVSDGSTCQFTRVLDWGGASLDIAVARAIDLTPSQAEPFKRQLSLEPGASDPEGLTPEKADAARQAVRGQLQAFARELVSSLQFYQNQPESLGIGEIVVTGGTAHLPGLASELQRLIGVLVRVGDPLGRVKVGKKVDEGDRIGSLAVAIGLGIED